MYCGGKLCGTYNNEEMVLPCILTAKDSRLGEFLHHLNNIIHDDRRLVFVDGRVLGCSNNWIRDHVHEMSAFKHWEHDLKSFLQFILDTQTEERISNIWSWKEQCNVFAPWGTKGGCGVSCPNWKRA